MNTMSKHHKIQYYSIRYPYEELFESEPSSEELLAACINMTNQVLYWHSNISKIEIDVNVAKEILEGYNDKDRWEIYNGF